MKEGNGHQVRAKILTLEYEECQIILYFISLDDFDEKLYEDDTQNGLVEALETFKNTLYTDQLREKPVLVVFTKQDVLQQKHQELSKIFQDYKGNSFEKACEYIESLFIKEFKPKERFTTLCGNVLDIKFIHQIEDTLFEISNKMETNTNKRD